MPDRASAGVGGGGGGGPYVVRGRRGRCFPADAFFGAGRNTRAHGFLAAKIDGMLSALLRASLLQLLAKLDGFFHVMLRSSE